MMNSVWLIAEQSSFCCLTINEFGQLAAEQRLCGAKEIHLDRGPRKQSDMIVFY
jgi:hypothetical protein